MVGGGAGGLSRHEPAHAQAGLWVVNLDEDAEDTADLVERFQKLVPEGDPVVAVSARLEEEGAKLSAEERTELFEGLGLGEGALAVMVRAAYQGLGLLSFYTVGPKESRAWTVRAGAAAPEAAGKIHSDLERGFIRAEVTTIDEVIEAGGWDAGEAAGIGPRRGKVLRHQARRRARDSFLGLIRVPADSTRFGCLRNCLQVGNPIYMMPKAAQ